MQLTPAFSQAPVFNDYGTYRFYALRRHNDIQGVEAVFDDYRRGWLKRYNSELLIGDANGNVSDTPVCSRIDRQDRARMTRVNCGSGHVFRFNLVGYGAQDGSITQEAGAISYVGYEHLVSDRFFLGVGATFGAAKLDHHSRGETLDVTTSDLGIHLIGGYRTPKDTILAWNLSYVFGSDDITRNGTITGTEDPQALAVTGVWYKNYDLGDDLHMSWGIDYTAYHFITNGFVDTTGQNQDIPSQWRGDFTTSLLFTQKFKGGEAFARLGSSIEVLQGEGDYAEFTVEPVDFTADFGGSYAISKKLALSGALGGSVRRGGATEWRASARLVAKF